MGTKVKAIQEAVSVLYALRELKQAEKHLIIHFIDALADQYGWSIEYIQNLTLEEIAQLINQIKTRKDHEDIKDQINAAKGFAGKISSNRDSSGEDKGSEMEKLEKLSRRLGAPIKKVKEDK